MADHIPFVGKADTDRLKKYYSDSSMVRVSLESIDTIRARLPKKLPLWIDPVIDGYDNLLKGGHTDRSWKQYIMQFQENQILICKEFVNKPDEKKVNVFVTSVLDKCSIFNPKWITVPQLPLVDDASRNNINRVLAKATGEWKSNSRFKGKLILPLIITSRKQLKGKTEWKAKLRVAMTCYKNAGASGVWAVDSNLYDQKGSGTFGKHFSQLIEFHRDLKETFPTETIKIAGPYWGMNLVLWARGLCDYPAISLGSAYRYYISGGFVKTGKVRLAIPPLRRWVVADGQLKKWLNEALKQIDRTDIAYKNFLYLKNNFGPLSTSEAAKDQVAKFYKKWFNKIEGTQPPGRALALYQDLSSAYITGKQEQLPKLPKFEAPGQAPERVAQQFMLQCL
jgi:hypothetical protein